MEELDFDRLRHVANLSKIEIKDDEELKNLSTKIQSIVKHAAQLEELDLDGVEPMTHVIDVENKLREDVAGQPLSQDEALKNTVSKEAGQFKVPRII